MEFTAEIELTPKALASAFWNMPAKSKQSSLKNLGRRLPGIPIMHKCSGFI